LGTVTLLATRFVLFLNRQGAAAYQTRETGAAFRDPARLWHNLRLHLEAGLTTFQVTGTVPQHWKAVAVVLAAVAGLAVLAAWRARATAAPRRRQYLLALAFG